jgi:aminoglycoside phosphotransferase (APT) family kinase protein
MPEASAASRGPSGPQSGRPDILDRAVTPARLTALLAERHPGVEVADVAVLGESSGSANRVRLALTYAPGADAGLPTRMFLKRNLERFSFPAEMYTTEVRIYRDVLPRTPVEAPTVYAIETSNDIEFTILMEDLSARSGVRIGFVLDPVTPDDVDSLLTTLASLHAAWWGSTALGWTRPPVDDPAMRFWREVGPRLTRRHLRAGHRAAVADQLPVPEAALWDAFDRLLAADSTGRHTLLHGDVHAGNVYYVEGGPGGLLDWQLSLRGCWALDVGYLLTSTLNQADRRTHERALLDGYLARLRALGVDAPSRDEAWHRYRQNALYGLLMWLITPDGVHSDDAQVEYLRRTLAAVDELETLEALRCPN